MQNTEGSLFLQVTHSKIGIKLLIINILYQFWELKNSFLINSRSYFLFRSFNPDDLIKWSFIMSPHRLNNDSIICYGIYKAMLIIYRIL